MRNINNKKEVENLFINKLYNLTISDKLEWFQDNGPIGVLLKGIGHIYFTGNVLSYKSLELHVGKITIEDSDELRNLYYKTIEFIDKNTAKELLDKLKILEEKYD